MKQTASNHGVLRRIGQSTLFIILCSLFISVSACSESNDEAADEFANWQARNDTFFLTLEDSLRSNSALWTKWKTFSKDQNTAGVATDYVYAKLLEKGYGSETPLYTDTVRVSYRGRLIPSTSYPQGYVFDQTYAGNYDIHTTDVADGGVGSYVNGFSTALQHMHRGDRYRIYIPYGLAYGSSAKDAIPAYSTLIFDVVLIDFAVGSGKMDTWSSRVFR